MIVIKCRYQVKIRRSPRFLTRKLIKIAYTIQSSASKILPTYRKYSEAQIKHRKIIMQERRIKKVKGLFSKAIKITEISIYKK